MRVGLLTHTTAGRGGIERVVEMHAEGLRGRGHDVDVISGPGLGEGWTARAIAAAGLAMRWAGGLRRYDVLLAHYPPAPWLAARSGVPYVHFFHSPMRALHPRPEQVQTLGYRVWSATCRPLAAIDRSSVARAHEVAVPSPSVAHDLQSLYRRTGVLLPLGVDTSVFRPDGPRPAAGHLLFAGRLGAPYKHLDWAYEVARRVGRPLHVVGEGRAPDPPRDTTIVRLGYLEGAELAEAYRCAGILLFPSVQEDFGLVPLEAMACGLPVVGWDDGHGPSLTLASGSGGLLAPPYDLDAFTGMVRSVLDGEALRRRLAAAGPSWVQQRFSVQRHIDGLQELLLRAVHDRWTGTGAASGRAT